ncbi:MAG: PDDEXK nuclease domain-containing protein [Gemmatimonadota bacterium]|nr:PDDEXK nuclease domain-containing protein [Gemmatimonadota bacterium]
MMNTENLAIIQSTGDLAADVRSMIAQTRDGVARTVNVGMTLLYWRIGKRIHYEILNEKRAEYGKEIVSTLSRQLTSEFGRGYNYSALTRMVRFADAFPEGEIVATLSQQLGWSHFKELLPLKQPLQREFYALELGNGFAFLARQQRIQIDSDDFYLDLLFYHRRLKRLIAIDLKLGDFKAEYKGQMELYLRWLARNEQQPGEASPLGIIMCAGKKEEQIELLELDQSGIHVAEYLTALPSRELLQQKLHAAIKTSRARLNAKDSVE